MPVFAGGWCRSVPVPFGTGAVEKPQETLSRFLYIKII
jgi:hypothetical protein